MEPTPPSPVERTADVRLLLAITLVGVLVALFGDRAPSAAEWTGLPAHRLDLATCTEGELQAVPGVGPVLAARIAAARRRDPLRSREDLLAVPGVGPVLAGRLLLHGRLPGEGAADRVAGGVSTAGTAPLAR